MNGAIDKMQGLCRDCKYFEVKNVKEGTHVWGLCAKPKDGGFEARARKSGTVFQWGDAICADFKAKTPCHNEK